MTTKRQSSARLLTKLLACLAAALAIFMFMGPVAAQASTQDISVHINGVPVRFEGQGPVIIDGRTLVPVRDVFETLGFTPAWDGEARRAILTRGSDRIVLNIDRHTFSVNGVNMTLEVPAQVIRGSTMIPLRAVLEAVDYQLEWNAHARRIDISSGLRRFAESTDDGRRYGFRNAAGDIVIPPTFTDTHYQGFTEGLIAANIGTWHEPMWGFVDRHGNVVIEHIYRSAQPFGGGLAAVREGDHDALYGFIDRRGRTVIAPMFERTTRFQNGLAAVATGSPLRWGFINQEGSIVVPLTFDWVGNFSSGVARVRQDGLYGIISERGNERIPISFEWIDDFDADGFARVRRNGLYGIVDSEGREIAAPAFDRIGSRWWGASVFSDGLVIVEQGNYQGIINTRGREVVPIIYNFVEDFQDGFAAVGMGRSTWDENTRWGLVDTNGELVVRVDFSSTDIRMIRQLMGRPADSFPRNVEQLHWDYVRPILIARRREPFQIFDVWTGITYNVLALSNGSHSDVEPVTARDTERLDESFNGVRTWSSRPVWVLVDGRVFAAAIHNMPHAQQTVQGNNMDGHVCLQF